MAKDLYAKMSGVIESLPSLPISAARVLEICNDPHTSPVDLNRVISLDPVLVGQVLKLINSAYYGMGRQAASLVRAIIMLGINTVKNLVLSAAVIRNLSTGSKQEGLNMEGFWLHSLCVGVTAKLIAKQRGVDPKLLEEYFTAGLLHDIGKIPLNTVLAQEYMLAVSCAERRALPLYLAETETLGMDHCAAGAMIVNAWKLEGSVKDVIIHHHNLDEYSGAYKDVLYCVSAANYFSAAHEIGFSGDRHPEKSGGALQKKLCLGADFFDMVEKTVNDEIEKAKIFLKI
jgi:putative nucleotidyltransferase with HDIG domain